MGRSGEYPGTGWLRYDAYCMTEEERARILPSAMEKDQKGRRILEVWQELTRQLQVEEERARALAGKREALVRGFLEDQREKFEKVKVCFNYGHWGEAFRMPRPYNLFYWWKGEFFEFVDSYSGGPILMKADTEKVENLLNDYNFIEAITAARR